MQQPDGIILGQPDPDYHGVSDRESNSSIDAMRISPRQWAWQKQQHKVPTPQMALGSAVHYMVLEGYESGAIPRMAVVPDVALNSNKGKDEMCAAFDLRRDTTEGEDLLQLVSGWKSPQKQLEPAAYSVLCQIIGGEPILADDVQAAECMYYSVMSDELAAQTLAYMPVREASVYWSVDIDGDPIALKSRVDMAAEDFGVIGDLKTCTNAGDADMLGAKSFVRAYRDMEYFRQAGLYWQALQHAGHRAATGFFFVAVQSRAPWNVAVYRVDPTELSIGWAQAAILLRRIADVRGLDPMNLTHTHRGIIELSLSHFKVAEIDRVLVEMDDE